MTHQLKLNNCAGCMHKRSLLFRCPMYNQLFGDQIYLLRGILIFFLAACGCNTEYSLGFGCNPNTGQCECLPGVIGEKCDHCPYRWVLKEEEGCFECDSCIHDLLDVTDQLRSHIDPLAVEFEVRELRYRNVNIFMSSGELYSDFDSTSFPDGVHSGAVGCGTALRSGKLRVRFPMVSLEIFINKILPATQRHWNHLSL